jgi:hypothetical protein
VDPDVHRVRAQRLAQEPRPVGQPSDQRGDARPPRQAGDVEAVLERGGGCGALPGQRRLGGGGDVGVGIADRADQRGRHLDARGAEGPERAHALEADRAIGVVGRHRQRRGATWGRGRLLREDAYAVQTDLDAGVAERAQQLLEAGDGRRRRQLAGRERPLLQLGHRRRHQPGLRRGLGAGARQERRQHHLPARAGVGDVVLVRDRVHDLDRAHRLEVRQLADAVHGVEPHPRPGVVGRDLQQLETPQAGVRARPDDRARRHRLRRVEHADQLGVGLADQLREHRHDGVDHLRARPVERRRDLHQVGALREPEVPDRLGRRPRHVGLGVAQERRQIAAGVPQRRQPEGRVRPHDRAAVAEREDEVFHDELGLGFHQLGVAQRTRLEIELPHGAAPILRRGPAATGGRGPGF